MRKNEDVGDRFRADKLLHLRFAATLQIGDLIFSCGCEQIHHQRFVAVGWDISTVEEAQKRSEHRDFDVTNANFTRLVFNHVVAKHGAEHGRPSRQDELVGADDGHNSTRVLIVMVRCF